MQMAATSSIAMGGSERVPTYVHLRAVAINAWYLFFPINISTATNVLNNHTILNRCVINNKRHRHSFPQLPWDPKRPWTASAPEMVRAPSAWAHRYGAVSIRSFLVTAPNALFSVVHIFAAGTCSSKLYLIHLGPSWVLGVWWNPALLCHKRCFSGCFIPFNHGWILPVVLQGSAIVRNNVPDSCGDNTC